MSQIEIDLTKNQIVDPPVKCWVRDDDLQEWIETELYNIEYRVGSYPFNAKRRCFKQCTLTDPHKPKIKKWETIMDVPLELWGKALVKGRNSDFRHAMLFVPFTVSTFGNAIIKDLVYLPLGQPLDGKWLEFESEIKDEN